MQLKIRQLINTFSVILVLLGMHSCANSEANTVKVSENPISLNVRMVDTVKVDYFGTPLIFRTSTQYEHVRKVNLSVDNSCEILFYLFDGDIYREYASDEESLVLINWSDYKKFGDEKIYYQPEYSSHSIDEASCKGCIRLDKSSKVDDDIRVLVNLCKEIAGKETMHLSFKQDGKFYRLKKIEMK